MTDAEQREEQREAQREGLEARPGAAPARDGVHALVREGYARVAEARSGCCAGGRALTREVARRVGYADADLQAVPEEANLGLGCGNPNALARLQPGEVVLDLGSGAGFDALLAARAVGPEGRVIGVDMTDAMLERARANARQAGLDNVDFRKGLIEALPVESGSVDVVISNCVVNLSPDKGAVFREAWRVLRPGGRLAVSDLVLERSLPESLRTSVEAYVGCLAGAALREAYLEAIREAGFRDVRVVAAESYAGVIDVQSPEIREAAGRAGLGAEEVEGVLDAVKSLKVTALR